jgi:hypothetical protein
VNTNQQNHIHVFILYLKTCFQMKWKRMSVFATFDPPMKRCDMNRIIVKTANWG